MAVKSQNNIFTYGFWCFSQSCQLLYLLLQYVRARAAHGNSRAKIARPAKTINQPGPGYGINIMPTKTTTPPLMPTTSLWVFRDLLFSLLGLFKLASPKTASRLQLDEPSHIRNRILPAIIELESYHHSPLVQI